MIFSPVLSQAIFMSPLSCKFSKAVILFEILNRFCSLTSTSLKFSRLNLYIWNFYAARLITDSLFQSFATTRQLSISVPRPREIGHQAYLNAISHLSRRNKPDCESSHHENFKCVYECFNAGTPCSWQLHFLYVKAGYSSILSISICM